MVYVCLVYNLTQFHRYINLTHTNTQYLRSSFFLQPALKKKKKEKRPRYPLNLFLFPLTPLCLQVLKHLSF